MAATATQVDLNPEFYPQPFPDGLPVINLARISLAKLLDDDEQEAALLFEVCKDKGFCYLDLMSHEKGVKLAKEAELVHQAAKRFFDTPVDEKRKFKTRPPETGLLDTGCVHTLCAHLPIPVYLHHVTDTERRDAMLKETQTKWRWSTYGPIPAT